MLRSLKDDLKIDKFALDVEAGRMPNTIQYWGEVKSVAESKRDSLYSVYKVLKNEKSLYFRSNPPEGVKITESVIENLIETDKEVREAHKAFLVAQEESATADIAYQAIRDKSSKIRDLIQLYLGGYFSDSRQSVSKKATNAGKFIADNILDE